MKKVWIVFVSVVMLLALGTAVYAATGEETGFKEMLPYMKQMHPDVSDDKLQEMYNSCHSEGNGMSGMMNGSTGNMMSGDMSSMMGNSGGMKSMMNTPAATVQ